MPTDTDFSVLETVVEVLKLLSYLTDALSGEKEVNASAVVPLLKHVKTKCTPSEGVSQLTKEMQTTIWQDIEPQYSSYVVPKTLSIASFLDPRFKDHYLEDKESTLLPFKRECMLVTPGIHDDTQSDNSHAASLSATEDTRASTEVPQPKRQKGLAAVLKCISDEQGAVHAPPTLTPVEKIDKAIVAYLEFLWLGLIQTILLDGE